MNQIHQFAVALGCFTQERQPLDPLPVDYAARVVRDGVPMRIELWRRRPHEPPVRLGVFDYFQKLLDAADANLGRRIQNGVWVESDAAGWDLPPAVE